jgi:hypothetical protein
MGLVWSEGPKAALARALLQEQQRLRRVSGP